MLKTLAFVIFASLSTFVHSQTPNGAQGMQRERLGAGDKVLDKIVTMQGKVLLTQVLDFLRMQDLSFVVAPDAAFLPEKVEFNIKEKPLRDLMEAMAIVFEGQWWATGDVYVFVGPPVIMSNGVLYTPRGRVVPPQGRGEAMAPAPLAIPMDGPSFMEASRPISYSTPFWRSLSKYQRSQVQSVGYLKLGQLNSSQKRMIGNPTADGSVKLVSSEGHVVKIKLST